VFALFAPQNAGFEHLSALAKVSRLLRDMDLRNKLRANPNSKTLYALLTEAQTMKAA
jgi:PTS system nitrogen regulatory IIA component